MSPAEAAAPAEGPKLTGGAAILAQLKARKAAAAAAKAAKPAAQQKVVFAYGSQTGTAAEIARTLHAEAVQRKINAEVMSLDELGFQNLNPENTPLLVVVASSTGDGDPPDNANALYLQIRKKQSEGLLKGVRFTMLGLGDSNYTRFMHVSRTLKTRLLELGATLFYTPAEADEVDGVENVVDPWVDGLWAPLAKAVAGELQEPAPAVAAAAAAPAVAAVASVSPPAASVAAAEVPAKPEAVAAAAAVEVDGVVPPKGQETVVAQEKEEEQYGLHQGLAPEGVDLKGAPAPLPCRIQIVWEHGEEAVATARSQDAARPSSQALQYRDPEGLYSHERPFWAEISEARYETADWSDRKVLHLQVELGDSGIAYEAGDSIGVVPVNPPELVAETLKHLKKTADQVFSVQAVDGSGKALLSHLPCPCTLGHALALCVDLTGAPKKSLLRMLAEHCSDAGEKRTLMYFTSRAGKEAYQHEIMEQQPSLPDLLARFPSCNPPLDALLDALPPLMPRLYSVTTSAVACPGNVQVALSVVRFQTRYGTRQGVATNWLDGLTQQLHGRGTAAAAQPIRIPIFLKRSADFKPPQDLSKPVIMIGPGTGVAPFRGFLQNRRALLQSKFPAADTPLNGKLPEGVAPAWLYFGCRREDEDYLYREDLQGFATDHTLTELKVAFSRAQAEKVYVQDLMKRDAAQLGAFIEAGGYVFVCGDGAHMAKAVHATLLLAVREHRGVGEEEAAQVLAAMVQEKRYIRDVWSA